MSMSNTLTSWLTYKHKQIKTQEQEDTYISGDDVRLFRLMLLLIYHVINTARYLNYLK